MLVSGGDEGPEQRMRFERLRFEFGMKLAAQIPGMVANLADLDVSAIRSLARDPQARRRQDLFILAIELVAMPVPLADLDRPVRLVGEAAFLQDAWPGAEPHRAAQLVHAFQLAQLDR